MYLHACVYPSKQGELKNEKNTLTSLVQVMLCSLWKGKHTFQACGSNEESYCSVLILSFIIPPVLYSASPKHSECVSRKRDIMEAMENKLDMGLDRYTALIDVWFFIQA